MAIEKQKIIHIMVNEKFIAGFIDFIKENFDASNHEFIILGKRTNRYCLLERNDLIWIDTILMLPKLLLRLNKASKIIIHGLWFEQFNIILFSQPWLLKKCYWMMWGGDFYEIEKQSWIKKQVIRKIPYLITDTTGDYELAKKWYSTTGKHIKCFNYPSNLYKEYNIKPKVHDTINIQLGNSADSTNNHIEVLAKLTKYKDENIKIFTPLSYGDEEYAKSVISYGKEIFGDKFVPLIEFMPFEKYLEFLSEIDIAIFAHKRQQAFGNIISLLSMGKKVYLNKVSTLNSVFNEINVKIFNLDEINLKKFDDEMQLQNIENIKYHYSERKLIELLNKVFTGDL